MAGEKGASDIHTSPNNPQGLVYEQLDGYHLVAVTERDYPLPDDVQLRWYSSGAAEYKFEVLRRPGDIKPDEFEVCA